MKSGKGNSKNFVSFFIDKGLMQYYIKSAKVKNKDYKFDIDYTLQVGEKAVNDSITINFSLSYKDITPKVKSLVLKGKLHEIILTDLDLIFNDKEENRIRFSTTFPNIKKDDFKNIVPLDVIVRTETDEIIFRHKKLTAQIETLNYLFE
jgi:hypothetical protein